MSGDPDQTERVRFRSSLWLPLIVMALATVFATAALVLAMVA